MKSNGNLLPFLERECHFSEGRKQHGQSAVTAKIVS